MSHPLDIYVREARLVDLWQLPARKTTHALVKKKKKYSWSNGCCTKKNTGYDFISCRNWILIVYINFLGMTKGQHYGLEAGGLVFEIEIC